MFKSIRADLGLVLGLLIFIGLASIWTTLWVVRAQSADALVINLAGRERMLSQRVAKLALVGAQPGQDPRLLAEMHATADEWEQVFLALRDGGQVVYEGRTITLPPTTDAAIRAQLERVWNLWQPFHSAVHAVLENPPESPASTQGLADVTSLSESILTEMNKGVQLYEAAAAERVALVERIQLAYLFIGALTVALGFTLMQRQILYPLALLEARVRRVIGSDLVSPVPVVTQNEIGTLAASFDEMRCRLLRRLEELGFLHRAALAVTTAPDLDRALGEIVTLLATELGFPHVGVGLLDESEERVLLRAQHGIPMTQWGPEGRGLRIGQGLVGWVVQHGQPLLVNDVSRDRRYVIGIPETQSEMVVPLRVGERVIGVINVESPRLNAFTGDDLRLLATLAGQVAETIERVRLFERVRLLGEAFNSAADAVMITDLESRILDVNPAFERLTGFSREEAIGQKPNILKSRHTTLEFYQQMWAQILSQGYWSGEIINRRKNGEEWDAFLVISTIKDERGQPVAYVGINRDITALKTLQREREVLFLAERAAREQAEALREVAYERLKRITALHEIDVAITSELNLAETLSVLLEKVAERLEVDAAAVALVDPETHALIYAARRGVNGELFRDGLLKVEEGVAGQVAYSGQVVAIPDVRAEPRFRRRAIAERLGIVSYLAVPLRARSGIIGVLEMAMRQRHTFHPEEIDFFVTLAGQAAIAIQNSRLFEQEQMRRQELAALYDLSRALADTTDIDTILDLITRRAVETVHVTFARIALVEGEDCVLRAAYPVRVLDHDLEVDCRGPVAAFPFCQRVLAQNAPILLRADSPDISDDERARLFLDLAQTLCLVPLRVGEHPLGLLMLGEMRREEREPFTADKLRLARSIGDQAASALHRVRLFVELERSYLQTVFALANAIDAKDSYTADHAQRLADMALAVGRELGMPPDELEDLRYGAILHDVGKIGIPDAILQKPARLDAGEWALMRRHPVIGAQILAPVPRLAGAARIVRHHHERYDGTGYPDGLAGEAIPLGARILAVVDAYGAIVDRRAYKEPCPHAEAIAELKRCAGTQLDPVVVEAFLRLFGRGVDS